MSDGCIYAPKISYLFTVNTINKELAEFYQKILSYLTGTRINIKKAHYSNRLKCNCKKQYIVTTKTHPIYKKLYERFYQGIPKRKTYHPFFKNISSLGLYLMLLGDGSKNGNQIRLHTENFTYAENMAIQKCMKDRFSIQFKIHKSKNKYYNLSATGINRNTLYKIVKPYLDLVPSMKYKFPTTEEIRKSEVWPEVRKNLPKDSQGRFISGSRHSLISQAIERDL